MYKKEVANYVTIVIKFKHLINKMLLQCIGGQTNRIIININAV